MCRIECAIWKLKAEACTVRKQRSTCTKHSQMLNRCTAPLRNGVDELPFGGPRLGLLFKNYTLQSLFLQDADISKNCTGGQVGSRLPLTQCKIKTVWADPAGPGGERIWRGGRKKVENNLKQMHSLLYIQATFFQEPSTKKKRNQNHHL